MPDKAILYIDIDDTLIAESFANSGYDLRPGIMTQLRCLAKLFDCCWLTHRSEEEVRQTFNGMYANKMLDDFAYADWRAVDPHNKAPYVVSMDKNFYWLEDPLSTGDMRPLREYEGLIERYIPVDPKGPWGFIYALNKLFAAASVGEKELKAIGAKIGWFYPPLIDVEKKTMLPAGTLRTGFVSNGKQHCGDCIHRTGAEKQYCHHPEVIRDPELASRVEQFDGKSVVPISNATECCEYIYKEANTEEED